MATTTYFRHALMLVEWLSLGGIVTAADALVQRIEHENMISLSTQTPHTTHQRLPHDAHPKDNATIRQTDFNLDFKRSSAMSITGLLWLGPLAMAWFPFLHRFMARRMSHLVEGSLKYVATKVVLENACLAMPICLGFFVIPAVVEGDVQLEALPQRMEQDFIPTLWTDIAFWTCFAPFNYKYVPLRYQPAVSCILGGVEAAGLSYITHIDGFEWPRFKIPT